MRDAAAAVLAGGRSTRFGSDKALAVFRGETLLGRAVRELAARFPEVAVVAKAPLVAAPAVALLDETELFTPLAGVRRALRWSPRALLFCCATDMPFAADDALLDALFAAVQGRDAAAPVHAGAVQPLCAIYRTTCLARVDALLPRGPRALLQAVDTAYVEWPDARPFLDADTPEALGLLQR